MHKVDETGSPVPEVNNSDSGESNVSGNSNNSKSKGLIIILIILFIGALAAAAFFYQRSQVVATVNGERITKDDYYQAMMDYYGDEILEEMINRKLILQEGQRLDVSVTQEEVDEEIDAIKNQFNSEEEFYQTLEEYGDSIDDLMDMIETDKLLEKIAMHDYDVGEEELKTYFLDNQMWFDIPEEIRLSHILVNSVEEANEVIRRLNGGDDFAELAGELSIDTFSKDEGGDLGFVERGELAYQFDEVFEDVAFSLDIEEYSEPVETYRGVHIICVLDRKETREVTYDEVSDEVERGYLNEVMGSRMHELLERLREEADIEKFIDMS